jgi:hypothetical protein
MKNNFIPFKNEVVQTLYHKIINYIKFKKEH